MTILRSALFGPLVSPTLVGFLLFFCAGFADGVMVPFFPLWARGEAGVAVASIGLLFACYAGGELLATPFLGGIADRIGRRPVLIASAGGVGFGFVVLPFTHGIVVPASVLLATGIFESVLHPTILTVIAESTHGDAHRRSFALARVSSSAGRVLGPATGALLALASLRWVFVAGGAMLLIGAVMTTLCLRETAEGSTQRDTDDTDDDDDDDEGLTSLVPALRDRRLALLLMWFLFLEMAGSWVEAVLPLYASDRGMLTPSGIGLLFTYGAALVVVAQMMVSKIAADRPATALTLAAGSVLVVALATLAWAPSVVGMVVAVSMVALADMLVGPLVPTAVNRLAPVGRRATYMAASSVANDLKDSLGPATGTALYAVGARLPWLMAMPMVAVAAVGLGTALGRDRVAADPRNSRGSEGTSSSQVEASLSSGRS